MLVLRGVSPQGTGGSGRRSGLGWTCSQASQWVGGWLGVAGDLLYPPECAGCRRRTVRGQWLCEECADQVRRVEVPRCRVCSRPFDGLILAFVCPNCRTEGFCFEFGVSVMRAHGLVRELVHRFKYGRERYLRRVLGDWLVEGLRDERLVGRPIDTLVPVPLHAIRQRERGYNQAEELARWVTQASGLPTEVHLRRRRHTVTQTQFDRRQRMRNLQDAFEVRKNAGVAGKHLLLVDDILTTGSTLDECARVLLVAGAASVNALTVARG